MQNAKYLNKWLTKHATQERYVFTVHDLRPLLYNLSDNAFKALLCRVTQSGVLARVCRGVYCYKPLLPADGLLLFHVAILLRSNDFNYISLETALSELGVISQIPMNWITIMTSGRSGIIKCSHFGTIEFIHTDQKISDLVNKVNYDSKYGMWRASLELALRDMKVTRRNSDLINIED